MSTQNFEFFFIKIILFWILFKKSNVGLISIIIYDQIRPSHNYNYNKEVQVQTFDGDYSR